MKKGFFFTIVASMCVICVGCTLPFQTTTLEKPDSPEKMFKAAEELYNKKNYAQALDVYEQLKSAYPEFNEMPKVYAKIGDCLFEDKQYDKSIGRYLEFVQLNPNDKDVPRAKYNIGMAQFNQIKNIDLDSRIIQKTAEAFKALSDDPNAGEWGKKAEEKYRECRQKLAAKELDKADTYVSTSNYKSAKSAARRVLDEYPNLGYDDKANALLKKLKNK
jgi:outer membrane protein assembly factor BamD